MSEKGKPIAIPIPHKIIEEHDGVIIGKTPQGYTVMSFDISAALNQENPRNVILNAQLFVEMQCDIILGLYFCKSDNRAFGVFSQFLQSEKCDFNTKIYLLKKMYKNDETTGLATPLIEEEIIASLAVIGRIRNGFHHNLSHQDAFEHSSKEGAKFSLIGKKLSEYPSIPEFIDGFKGEVLQVHEKLGNLITEMATV